MPSASSVLGEFFRQMGWHLRPDCLPSVTQNHSLIFTVVNDAELLGLLPEQLPSFPFGTAEPRQVSLGTCRSFLVACGGPDVEPCCHSSFAPTVLKNSMSLYRAVRAPPSCHSSKMTGHVWWVVTMCRPRAASSVSVPEADTVTTPVFSDEEMVVLEG